MILESHKSHVNINSELSLNDKFTIFYCVFSMCYDENGGAIYSDIDKIFTIISNFFINCSAKTRGGAVYIEKGEVILRNSCSDTCTGPKGSDIILWPNGKKIEYINMQNIKCISDVHAAYFEAEEQYLRNVNVSNNEISQDINLYHGNAFCTSNCKTLSLKYMNIFGCSGAKSLILFEHVSDINPSFSYINAYENLNNQSFLSFSSTSNVNLCIKNSNFIGNSAINYFYIDKDNCESIHISFFDCSFSLAKENTDELSFDDNSCQFNKENDENSDKYNNIQCFLLIDYSFPNNIFSSFIIPLFISIFVLKS